MVAKGTIAKKKKIVLMRVGTKNENSFSKKKMKKAYKTFLASRSDASWLDTVAVTFPKGMVRLTCASSGAVRCCCQEASAENEAEHSKEPGRALRAVAF